MKRMRTAVRSSSGEASQSVRLGMLIVMVGVVSALHVGKLPPAIPVLSDRLGLGLVQGGFLLSIIQLAGMTLGAVAGTVADRMGPRRIMLIGLLLLAGGSFMGATASTPALLLLTRAIEGMGFLMAVLPAPVLLRRLIHEPGALQKGLGFWGAYMPVGTALALLSGPLAYQWMGWRLSWVMLGVLVMACAWAVWTRIPADRHDHTSAAAPVFLGLKATLSAPGPWLVALAFLVYSGQWLAVVGFLPTIYTQAGWSVAWIGPLTALAAGVNLIGNIAAGRLLAMGLSPATLLWSGYGVMATGAFFAFSGWMPAVGQYVAVLLFSAVGGLIPGTLFTLAVHFAPSGQTVTTTVGWVQQLSSLGQFASPPLVAWMATVVGGWQLTWVFNVLCCLCGAWLAWRLQLRWRERKR